MPKGLNAKGLPRQRAIRIGRLNTPLAVAAELGRVYRQARREELEPALASRLANILATLRQCLETAEIEERLKAIEEAVSQRDTSVRPLRDSPPKLVDLSAKRL
jgi:hypothetical protein